MTRKKIQNRNSAYALLVVALLTLCSCTVAARPPQWEPTERHTANSDLQKDTYECERDKRSTNFKNSYESRTFINEAIWDARADAFYTRCMEVRGWKLAKP